MRKLVLAVLLALCAVLVTAPTGFAAKPGNSPNAKACQKGNWANLVRADQTAFSSEQECTSYAAKGGVLTEPTPATAASTCVAEGGTYGAGPDLTGGVSGGTIIFTCNGRTNFSDPFSLNNFCFATTGFNNLAVGYGGDPADSNITCSGFPN